MPADELLTKDEMDALMEVVSRRKGNAASSLPMEDTQSYELVSPENTINSISKVLETIHERLAHRLRVGLFELLGRDVEVVVSPVETRGYNDLITALTTPCSINIIGISPLSGPGLLIFDRQLVFMIVDTFFGGTGRVYISPNARDFTATESRFIQRLLKLTFQCLEAAWQPFMAINCTHLNAESNPQFVTAINPNELLAVTSLQINKDESAGALHLALPCSMFEPVRAALLTSLYKEHPRRNDRLTRFLHEGVKDSTVDTRCFLTEIELTLGELLSLKAGDVIPMDIPTEAVLEAEGIPVYSGRYGVAQGWRALKIEHTLTSLTSIGSYSNNEEIKL